VILVSETSHILISALLVKQRMETYHLSRFPNQQMS
jgi:hypothetical protein